MAASQAVGNRATGAGARFVTALAWTGLVLALVRAFSSALAAAQAGG